MSHNRSYRRCAAIVLIAAASLSLPLTSVAQAQQRSEHPRAARLRASPYAAQWNTYNAARDHTAFHGHFIDPWNDPRSNDANGG